MLGFEGWWIKGSKGIHVAEHWMEIRNNPEQFGLTEEKVQEILASAKGKFSPGDTGLEGQRGKLLRAAMENGWIRVRGYRASYAIELSGRAASVLPNVLKFLTGAGVHKYSMMRLHDFATGYHQEFREGISDIKAALRKGEIPDSQPGRLVGSEAKAALGGKEKVLDGIPDDLTDKQKRILMRQRLGQQAKIPDPSPGDDKMEESRRAKGKPVAEGKLWNRMKRFIG
jgi:hypothetical protein